jgi:putative redox protein
MKATVNWLGNVRFAARAGSGHTVLMDGPPEEGGENLGIRPMEMVLAGLGGCAAFDVVTILRKARQDVTACRAELEAQRADEPPKVFTRIHIHFVVTGRNIKESQLERAIELSADKYCSASIMLGKTAEITHSYEIESADDRP